jgi:hypothetical protein
VRHNEPCRQADVRHKNLFMVFLSWLRRCDHGDRPLLAVDPTAGIDGGNAGDGESKQQNENTTRTHGGLLRVSKEHR